MSIYKTDAIILRTIKYGEADKILTMLSPDGQIQAIAKGSRRVKSRLGGRLEPFCYVNLVLYKGKNLHTITQASLIKPHKTIREDYSKYVIAFAATELVGKVTFAGQKEEEIFGLLKAMLNYLDSEIRKDELVLLYFEWQILKALGFQPNLDTKGRWFNLEEGGLEENPPQDSAFEIDSLTISLLKSIIIEGFDKLNELNPEKSTLKRFSILTKQYMDLKLQTKIKSRSFVD